MIALEGRVCGICERIARRFRYKRRSVAIRFSRKMARNFRKINFTVNCPIVCGFRCDAEDALRLKSHLFLL